jgi:hypothetical protein
MKEKELLENILAADILILAECMEMHNIMLPTKKYGSCQNDAVQKIKTSRRDLIQLLISEH